MAPAIRLGFPPKRVLAPIFPLFLGAVLALPCSAGNRRVPGSGPNRLPVNKASDIPAVPRVPKVDLNETPPINTNVPASESGIQRTPAASVVRSEIPAQRPEPVPPSPTLRETLGAQEREIQGALASDPSGAAPKQALDRVFFGASGKDSASDGGLVVNDEGIGVFDRAEAYYKEVRRLVDKFKGRLDLSETLDVMDDTYSEVWTKLATIEQIARSRNTEDHNMHLEETLTWVDAVMRGNGRSVAIHTHQVFFHHAANPQSEIREGIRRVDRYLDEALEYFKSRGRAEWKLERLDEVILAFDTRGYQEIKDHLKAREREISRAFGRRFHFAYVDELVRVPRTVDEMRAGLNVLIQKYKGDGGLEKIIEGVTYSRYVGLLLELKTDEHFFDLGYEILQSGKELFDAQGHYITEIDTLVRSPQGRVTLVEAKSARVPLPFSQVLQDKIVYKLETYKRNRAFLESAIGSKIDRVVFSVDVGRMYFRPNDRPEAIESVKRHRALAAYLKGHELELSRRYGFPVEFLFIWSHPERSGPGAAGRRS